MITAREALDLLRQGNRRFIAGRPRDRNGADAIRRLDLLAGQEPHAAILGCSDSRVPVELIFDQEIGDLFVVRVAGNIADSTQIGSIEFAVANLGTPLVVVLGHSGCGAVAAAVEEARQGGERLSPHLGVILDRVRPAVTAQATAAGEADEETALRLAVQANVAAAVARLETESQVLTELVASDRLLIVGAVYELGSGAVEFLEDDSYA